MFVVMLQKCKSFLKTAAFYALVEKKNWAWCHLKTNWLMRRQLVKGGNFEKYIHFWSIPTNVLALFVFFQGYSQLMYNSKWRKKMLKIGTFYWTLTASFSEWRIFSCSSSTRRSSNLIKTSVDSLSSKVCSRDTSLQSHPAYSIIG